MTLNAILDMNKDRKRYYGLRRGDIVEDSGFNGTAKVIDYNSLDNNQVVIKLEPGNIMIPYVAELLKIVKKVDS